MLILQKAGIFSLLAMRSVKNASDYVSEAMALLGQEGSPVMQASKPLDKQYAAIVDQQIHSAKLLSDEWPDKIGDRAQYMMAVKSLLQSFPKVRKYLQQNAPTDARLSEIDKLQKRLEQISNSDNPY